MQATFFGRLLFVSNNFSFKQRGEDNSLFTKNIITYMHRSNNSSPYPMFERLFAVILSVTDIKKITFVVASSAVVSHCPLLMRSNSSGVAWVAEKSELMGRFINNGEHRCSPLFFLLLVRFARFASLVSYSFISNLSKSFCLISSYALMKRSFVWLYIIMKSFMLHKSLAMYCFS